MWEFIERNKILWKFKWKINNPINLNFKTWQLWHYNMLNLKCVKNICNNVAVILISLFTSHIISEHSRDLNELAISRVTSRMMYCLHKRKSYKIKYIDKYYIMAVKSLFRMLYLKNVINCMIFLHGTQNL